MGRPSGKTISAVKAEAITPSDTVNITGDCRGVYVGGAGDVAAVFYPDDAPVIFKAVPVGTVLPIQPQRINASGTSATFLVALL